MEATPPPFGFIRLDGRNKHHSTSLGDCVGSDDIKQEKWLFVSPHDDDACIGAGLWIQAVLHAGAQAHLLVITDGRMGYCKESQKASIVETRRVETHDSCTQLGLDPKFVRYIDYPDGGLFTLQGRQAYQERPDIDPICGHVGLQNALTYHLRSVQPTRVVIPSPTDLHPDHRITHSELLISLFHASGKIWPELGPATHTIAPVYEMAIYCDFSGEPNLRVEANAKIFERKLQSIAAFRSQAQIMQLVENVRSNGPCEHLRELDFHLYESKIYDPLFT